MCALREHEGHPWRLSLAVQSFRQVAGRPPTAHVQRALSEVRDARAREAAWPPATPLLLPGSPRCGIKIGRVAQVIDDLVNPLVIPADRTLGRLAHSVSLCRSPAHFVGPSNTVLTPVVGQGRGGTLGTSHARGGSHPTCDQAYIAQGKASIKILGKM